MFYKKKLVSYTRNLSRSCNVHRLCSPTDVSSVRALNSLRPQNTQQITKKLLRLKLCRNTYSKTGRKYSLVLQSQHSVAPEQRQVPRNTKDTSGQVFQNKISYSNCALKSWFEMSLVCVILTAKSASLSLNSAHLTQLSGTRWACVIISRQLGRNHCFYERVTRGYGADTLVFYERVRTTKCRWQLKVFKDEVEKRGQGLGLQTFNIWGTT